MVGNGQDTYGPTDRPLRYGNEIQREQLKVFGYPPPLKQSTSIFPSEEAGNKTEATQSLHIEPHCF